MDTCPICMENIEEGCIETPCNHKFHVDCLEQWREQNSCPVCRTAIDENRDVRRLHVEPREEDEKEIAVDLEHKELIQENNHHFNENQDFEDRMTVVCCVCQNDIELENAINCNVCGSSYFCSNNCMNLATIRQHTCEFANIDPNNPLFRIVDVQTFP